MSRYAPRDKAVEQLYQEMNRPNQSRSEDIFDFIIAGGMILSIILVPPFNVIFGLALVVNTFRWASQKLKSRKARRLARKALVRKARLKVEVDQIRQDQARFAVEQERLNRP
jgi:hypothetical protein